jgi:murein DD-endopeptidase MepM/ murein hydrolase activator NlpD
LLVITRFRLPVVGVLIFVFGFCQGVSADEAFLEAPAFISPPPLPSVESFGTPNPPGIVKNAGRIMPDVDYWQDGKKAAARALAKMEESAFEGLKDVMLVWPVRGRISSGFGWRGSGKRKTIHEGIDIPVPKGTPVQAALPGVVTEARVYNGYGKTVVLDHGNGTKTLYAHCSKIAVKRGEYVEAGQVIAYAGSTGRSTTSHLHFGVIVAGVFRDPETILKTEPLRLVRKP